MKRLFAIVLLAGCGSANVSPSPYPLRVSFRSVTIQNHLVRSPDVSGHLAVGNTALKFQSKDCGPAVASQTMGRWFTDDRTELAVLLIDPTTSKRYECLLTVTPE